MSKQIKLDAWANILTGLGIKGRDKKTANQFHFDFRSQRELEELYAGEETASKIVDTLPEDMFRAGFSFKINGKKDKDEVIKKFFEKHQINEKILASMKKGRLYGGAAIITNTNDNMDLSKPLNYKAITKVNWVRSFNRHELSWTNVSKDPAQEYFRHPEFYYLVGESEKKKELSKIHRTRFAFFSGEELPKDLYETNSYWHNSVLCKAYSTIEGYATSYEKIYSILEDFVQSIFKIKNLGNLIGNGKDDVVAKRLQLVDVKRSVVKSIVIDADGEDFTRNTVNLSGVEPVLGKIENRLSQVGNMPHTKMLGEGSAGVLSGSGDSELKEWYDYVSRKRKPLLTPALVHFAKIALAEARQYNENETIEVEYESLYEEPKSKIADTRLKIAQTDNIYLTNQVITPDEVAKSRFGGEKYNMETELDDSIPRDNLEPLVDDEE